jgi:hypothetical protein
MMSTVAKTKYFKIKIELGKIVTRDTSFLCSKFCTMIHELVFWKNTTYYIGCLNI